MNTHDFSSDDQPFLTNLEKSQQALEALRTECTVHNLNDPLALIHEKRMLINQLDLILSLDILVAWEQCKNQEITSEEIRRKNDELKIALQGAMKAFYIVVASLQNVDIHLKKEEEEKFQQSLLAFDKTLTAFKIQTDNYNKQANNFSQQYAVLKKDRKLIEYVTQGAKLSTSMGWLATTLQILTIIGFAFAITLEKAAVLAGSIFYPISALLSTVTKSFDLFSTHTLLGQLKSEREIALNNIERLHRIKEVEHLLKKEQWLRITSLILTGLAAIALLTALTSPIGWGLMAVVTIIDWREAGVNGVKKASLEYQHAQADLLKKHDPENDEKLQNIVEEKRRALAKARTEERWYLINAVAMVLFAASPIPVIGPALLAIGLVTFSIAAIRNIVVGNTPRLAKLTSSKKSDLSEESEMTETLTHKNAEKLTPKHTQKLTLTTNAQITKSLLADNNNNTQNVPSSPLAYYDLEMGPITPKQMFPQKNKEQTKEKSSIELTSEKLPNQK